MTSDQKSRALLSSPFGARSLAVATATGAVLALGVTTPAQSAVVQGRAWVDANADGRPSSGEHSAVGLRVRLERRQAGRWVRIGTRRAASNGRWRFAVRTPGTYRVRALLPASAERFSPRRSGGSRVSRSGVSTTLRIRTKHGTRTVQIGIAPKRVPTPAPETPVVPAPPTQGPPVKPPMVAVIRGTVWSDVDGDGVRGPTEPVLPGVQVEVSNEYLPGTSEKQQSSGPDGKWEYRGYGGTAGYRVRVIVPDGFSWTPYGRGTAEVVGSDIHDDGPRTGYSDPLIYPYRVPWGSDGLVVPAQTINIGLRPAG